MSDFAFVLLAAGTLAFLFILWILTMKIEGMR